MIRVVHLSVVHKPDDPRIHERECRTLAAAGYAIMYLAPGAARGRDEHGVLLAPLPQRGRSTRFLDSIEIAQALRALRPQVLHVHDPELLTLFPAVKAFIPRLVYDMHEYVPEAVASKHYIPARARPSASRATVEPSTFVTARTLYPLRFASRRAARVSIVSPDWLITKKSVFRKSGELR